METSDEEYMFLEETDRSRSSSRGRSRVRSSRRSTRRNYGDGREIGVVKLKRKERKGIIQSIREFIKNVRGAINFFISTIIKSFLFTSVLSFFLFYCAILTALFYIFLYWYMIPVMEVEAPLFFDYDVKQNGQQSFAGCEPSYDVRAFKLDEQIELPTAVVEFAHSQNQWHLRESFITKNAVEKKANKAKSKKKAKLGNNTKTRSERTHKQNVIVHQVYDWRTKLPKETEELAFLPYRFLAKGEKYDIYVYLGIRDSELNYMLGNVMVGVELMTYQKQVLASSRRPTIVRRKKHQSFLSWFLANSLLRFLPFLSTDENYVEAEEENLLKILSFERFMEQDEDFLSIQSAKVTLSQPSLQLHHATLVFRCQLDGLRYYMYHWRTTTFVLYMAIFFTIEAISAIFTSLIALLISVSRAETEKLFK